MRALIIVDVQNDFCPGGTLAVREGNLIVPVINRIQKNFEIIVATQDWHPADHMSFASSHGKRPGEEVILDGLKQVLWRDHCVQGTWGAQFRDDLDIANVQCIFQKGTDRRIDSYSGFFDNGHRKSTGMSTYLKDKGVDEVVMVGLATDYCIRFTALDAAREGFKTRVIEDACRAVNLKDGDDRRAFDAMRKAGVAIETSGQLMGKAC